ncbi:MAG: divalent-cation tolerance protein CutA [Rhodanobacteraceae bacterium]
MNIVVFCTCPNSEFAVRIAEALVEARLAACVSRLPGAVSTYRWQGQTCTDSEVLLMIKTTSQRFPALEALTLELHPHEVPELIAVPIERGHQPYLQWLAASTAESDPPPDRS